MSKFTPEQEFFLRMPTWWGAAKTASRGRQLSKSELSVIIYAGVLSTDGFCYRNDATLGLACAYGWSLTYCAKIVKHVKEMGYIAPYGGDSWRGPSARMCLTPAGEAAYKDFIRVYTESADKFIAILNGDKKGMRFKIKDLAINAQV